MAAIKHQLLLRALDAVSKDRHIKSLQHYDEVAVDNDDIAQDEAQQQTSAKFHKSISDHSKGVIHLAEVLKDVMVGSTAAQSSLLSHAQLSFDADADALMAALQEAKSAAKELGHADDEADSLLQAGTPPRDIIRRRHDALSHVVAGIWNIYEILASVEGQLAAQHRQLSAPPGGRQQAEDNLSDDFDDGEGDGETLEEIAAATGYSIDALRYANPALRSLRGHDVVPVGTSIRLPSVPASTSDADRASVAAAIAAAAAFEEQRTNASSTTPRSDRRAPALDDRPRQSHSDSDDDGNVGETLADIAAKTGVPLRTLEELNQDILTKFHPTQDIIPVGTPVRIPEAAAVAMSEQFSSRTPSSGGGHHAARTTSASSRQQHFPPSSSRAESHTDPRSTSSMQRKHRPTTATSQTQSYTVTETLADVAKATDVTIAELRYANPDVAAYGDHAPLPPNTKLVIPSFTSSSSDGEDGADAEVVSSGGQDGRTSRLDSTKRPDVASAVSTSNRSSEDRGGDTLAEVAALYGVSVETLVAHNPELADIGHDDYLPVGLSIRIPTDGASVRSISRSSSSKPPELQQVATSRASHPRPSKSSVASTSGVDGVDDDVATASASGSNSDAASPPHTIASLSMALGVPEDVIRAWNPSLQHVASHQVLAEGLPIRIPNKDSDVNPSIAAEANDDEDARSKSSSEIDDDTAATAVSSPRRSVASNATQQSAVSLPIQEAVQKHRPLPPSSADVPASRGDVSATAPSTTLAMIAAEFSLTTQQIRRLNPHLRDVADDALIPPFTSLLLPKKPQGPLSSSRGVSPTSTAESARLEDQPSQPIAAPRGVSEGQKTTASNATASSRYHDEDNEDHDDDDDDHVPHEDAPAVRSPDVAVDDANLLSADEGPTPLTNAPVPALATPLASLATIAQAVGVSVEELRELNPKLRQYPEHLPLPKSANVVIPSRSASHKSQQSVAQSKSDAASNVHHQDNESDRSNSSGTPQSETLASVSDRYNIPISIIREHNPSVANLGRNDPIPASTALKLPLTATQRQQLGHPSNNSKSSHSTTSQRASSAASTASSASRAHPRQADALSSSPTASPPKPFARAGEHKCTSAKDTLKSIAHKYHVTVSALRHVNPAFSSCDAGASLPAGIVLQLPAVATPTGAQHSSPPAQRNGSPGRGASARNVSEGPVSTIADDEELREATPRDTLYSDASRIDDERLMFDHEGTMTSPNHSARLVASDPLPTPSHAPQSTDAPRHYPHEERYEEHHATIVSRHYESGDDAEDDDEPADHHHNGPQDDDAHEESYPREPYTDSGRDGSFQHPQFASAQERDATVSAPHVEGRDTALEGVALIRADGESIQQLARRLQVREPELRSVNPQLQHFHHSKPLPKDTLVTVPRHSSIRSGSQDEPQRVSATRRSDNLDVSPALPQQKHTPTTTFVDPSLHALPAQPRATPSVTFVSKNAPKVWESDGTTTVAQVCTRFFVREDVLREWNPFLRRYHSKTVVPPGATIYLEPRLLLDGSKDKSSESSPVSPDSLPVYVRVSDHDHVSLKTIALRHRLHEGGLRKLNPHVSQFPFDALLPAGTAVCVKTPALTRWESRIPSDRISSVGVLESKCNDLIRQRYFLNWKALAVLQAGRKEVEQAELKEERDQLHEQVAIGKMCEADLRRRVTELRMVVDSMRGGGSPTRFGGGASNAASSVAGSHGYRSPSRGISPSRNPSLVPASYSAFVAKSVDRAASLVAVSGAGGGVSPARIRLASRGRELSPIRRTPVVADVGGVAWVTQPERVASISPVRARSGTRTVSPVAAHHQLRLAQAVAHEVLTEYAAYGGASPAPTSTLSRATISPRRGQKPSLGLMLSGLRVTGVTGSAEAAGIRVNDAVLRVDGKLVSNAVSFRDSVARAPGPRVCITVQHPEGGSTAFMLPLYSAVAPRVGSSTSTARASSPTRRILSSK